MNINQLINRGKNPTFQANVKNQQSKREEREKETAGADINYHLIVSKPLRGTVTKVKINYRKESFVKTTSNAKRTGLFADISGEINGMFNYLSGKGGGYAYEDRGMKTVDSPTPFVGPNMGRA